MRDFYSSLFPHCLDNRFIVLYVDGFENESEDLAQTADGTSGAKPLEKLGVTHEFLKLVSHD